MAGTEITKLHVRDSSIFATMKIQVLVLEVVTPCSGVVGYQRCRGLSAWSHSLHAEDGGSMVQKTTTWMTLLISCIICHW